MNYNPYLLGYAQHADGRQFALRILLQDAEAQYGRLPTRAGALGKIRFSSVQADMRLHLPWGLRLWDWLLEKRHVDVAWHVLSFAKDDWQPIRDWQREFGIRLDPLRSLMPAEEALQRLADLHSRYPVLSLPTLREVSKAIDQSGFVPAERIARTAGSASYDDPAPIFVIQRLLDAAQKQERSGHVLAPAAQSMQQALKHWIVFARAQTTLPPYAGRKTFQQLVTIRPDLLRESAEVDNPVPPGDLVFSLCERTIDYLTLGSRFRDCTAKVKRLQDSLEVKNIFFTTQSWLFDPNYSILLCKRGGKLLLKAHLLPLHADIANTSKSGRQASYFFLHLDAIEATVHFRTDLDDTGRAETLDRLFAHVLSIADGMGLHTVMVEQFSNDQWVRDELMHERHPKVFLDTTRITKIDDLEDVFACTQSFFRQNHIEFTDGSGEAAIFMEIQALNTSLIPMYALTGHFKSFVMLRGDPDASGYALSGIFKV